MITTRLTERLGIEHPVIQAPMAFAAGGQARSSRLECRWTGADWWRVW